MVICVVYFIHICMIIEKSEENYIHGLNSIISHLGSVSLFVARSRHDKDIGVG